MIQILRAYLYHLVGEGAAPGAPTPDPSRSGVRLVYAAEREYDLCFTDLMASVKAKYPDHFSYYIVLVRGR